MSAAGAAVAALDPARLRALAQRSDARGWRQLGLHALILVATGAAVAASRGHAWLPAVMVLHGIALDFLFCALHESAHRTAFASRRLNEALAWGAGALLILPPRFFRAFHFAHHRHAQDPKRDPELARPPPATLSAYLWHLSGMPNWSRRISVTLRHALTGRVREPFVAERRRPAIVREARLLWTVYGAVLGASLLLRSDAALVYWIVPAMLGQPFLRGFLLAEHTGCALGDDPFTNTRTTYTNAALRALSWQMPYHVEHHAHPAVPFHALERLNALYRSRIGVSAPGYWAVHRALVRRLRTGPGAAPAGAG